MKKVSITFFSQKNIQNIYTVTQWKTGKALFLVKFWVGVIA